MQHPIERIAVSVTAAAILGGMCWPVLAVCSGIWAPGALLGVLVLAGIGVFRSLPPALDGVLRRHRVLALAWVALALLTVVQTARLARYVVDPTQDWWHTTQQEFWSRHSCMSAYFYAADLSRQGVENIYDPDLYPVLNPEAANRTTVESLQPEDPYQYPPQFLLVPRLALSLSNDYRHIQAFWFTLQALLFVLGMGLLARWIGGRSGAFALWTMPLLWISVPSILNFQYGQFHVTTIVLAVAALVAFERRRDAAGGGLLATAILAKGFPGILLVPLVLQRRWRALMWTVVGMTVLTTAAWFVLGPAPFEAFVSQHLPRLRSGDAFAFDEVWPEWKDWLLAGNISLFSFVRKLSGLGLIHENLELARVVQSLFVGVLFLAACFTRWRGTTRQRALRWMALLNLAAFSSPAAWGDYIPVGTLWMLLFLFDGGTAQRWSVGALIAFCALLPGIVAIGDFPSPHSALFLSLIGTLLLLGTNAWVLQRALRFSPAAAPRRGEAVGEGAPA